MKEIYHVNGYAYKLNYKTLSKIIKRRPYYTKTQTDILLLSKKVKNYTALLIKYCQKETRLMKLITFI